MYWSSQNNIRIRHVLAHQLFTLFSVAALIKYGCAVRPFAQRSGAGIAMGLLAKFCLPSSVTLSLVVVAERVTQHSNKG